MKPTGIGSRYEEVLVPRAMVVTYAFGGALPLVMRDVASHNLAEYEKAAACFRAYIPLLDEAMSSISLRTATPS